MKKLEKLSEGKFQKLEIAELSVLSGGRPPRTEMDTFICTASNPNEGDGGECDGD